MQRKSKLIVIVLIMMFALAGFGCSKDSEQPTKQYNQEIVENNTLEFEYNPVGLKIYAGKVENPDVLTQGYNAQSEIINKIKQEHDRLIDKIDTLRKSKQFYNWIEANKIHVRNYIGFVTSNEEALKAEGVNTQNSIAIAQELIDAMTANQDIIFQQIQEIEGDVKFIEDIGIEE